MRRIRAGAALAVLLAVATISGCTSGPAPSATRPADRTTTSGASTELSTSGRSAAPEPERYDGPLDGFYEVPDPLPPGQPGDLLRVQRIGAADGLATDRVMYLSEDSTGAPRATTGVITHPTGEAPADGWPVVSTAHGTTGIATPCAPSRSATAAPGWGIDGVWAMTDYVGLGPIGERHAYLSKADEGNAVIDIVRAARNLPDAHAGTRWVAVGHSQGGHGALAAHELAAARAPELQLEATVALAPAALLDRVYGGIDPIVTTILTMMGVYGSQAESAAMTPGDYFTPAALEAAAVFDTGCLDEITDALIPVAIDGAFAHDPRETEPARSVIRDNDVGSVAVEGVPLFLASGTDDDRVVIDRFRDTVHQICETGQVARVVVVPGATHDSVIGAVSDQVTSFLDDALAGRPPTDDCPDVLAAP